MHSVSAVGSPTYALDAMTTVALDDIESGYERRVVYTQRVIIFPGSNSYAPD